MLPAEALSLLTFLTRSVPPMENPLGPLCWAQFCLATGITLSWGGRDQPSSPGLLFRGPVEPGGVHSIPGAARLCSSSLWQEPWKQRGFGQRGERLIWKQRRDTVRKDLHSVERWET